MSPLVIYVDYLKDTIRMLIFLSVYETHESVFCVLGTRAISHLCSSICSCKA